MSALKNLLSSASRQYVCLLQKTLAAEKTVQNAGICMSRCLNNDNMKNDNMNNTEQPSGTGLEHQTSRPLPEQRKKSVPGLGKDYSPGGLYIPTDEVYEMKFDGVRYDELPVVLIKARMQNTLAIATIKDVTLSTQSGGTVGFKNSKKKSNVCGQTVGLAIGSDMIKKGYKNARVIVKGQGAGRLPSIKGVSSAGVNIVSITDMTYPNVTCRPRKARRV